jgi:rhodanese-related sulfurtransferase
MDGEIAPEEVKRALEDGDAPVVVDIRSPAAYKQGHIPDSRNVPFGELPDRVESLTDADHIVTVCPHGKASVQAARMIGSYEGIDDARVDSMAGGLAEWPGDLEAADGPDDTASPESTDGESDASTSEATDAPF